MSLYCFIIFKVALFHWVIQVCLFKTWILNTFVKVCLFMRLDRWNMFVRPYWQNTLLQFSSNVQCITTIKTGVWVHWVGLLSNKRSILEFESWLKPPWSGVLWMPDSQQGGTDPPSGGQIFLKSAVSVLSGCFSVVAHLRHRARQVELWIICKRILSATRALL